MYGYSSLQSSPLLAVTGYDLCIIASEVHVCVSLVNPCVSFVYVSMLVSTAVRFVT